MGRHKTLYLRDLFFLGFHSGMRWKTQGTITTHKDGTLTESFRFLLRFPGSLRIARLLVRGLGSDSKTLISYALADLYDYAADNVEHCMRTSPQDFFAEAKDSRSWSAKLSAEEFWALTYRLFHARALFLASTSDRTRGEPNGQPLIVALDNFKDRFEATYDVNCTPDCGKTPHQEEIERVEDVRFLRRELHTQYFQLCQANQEGDGTDQIFTGEEEQGPTDPSAADYKPDEKVPREMNEIIGFYYDLGPRNPRYGYKDAYQEIEDAMRIDEEERQAKDAVIDDDEGDIAMMMMDANPNEEIVDINMDSLAF
ncbi:hypothetical protein F5Y19DRAFT_482988 [Xylariaceae sp. FL1651]|nr:hypothetical protein F5Y19DRAFT_482988 [Xylariaceae sp. FL1651]